MRQYPIPRETVARDEITILATLGLRKNRVQIMRARTSSLFSSGGSDFAATSNLLKTESPVNVKLCQEEFEQDNEEDILDMR